MRRPTVTSFRLRTRHALVIGAFVIATPPLVMLGASTTSHSASGRTFAAAPRTVAAAEPRSLTSEDTARVDRALKRTAGTVRWIENKGQFPRSVLYSFSAPDSRVLVERDRLRFEFVRELPETRKQTVEGRDPEPRAERYASHSFVVHFDGANRNVQTRPGDAFSTVYNYFSGNERSKWVSGVSAYKEVTLRNLYPGISLRLYSQAGSQLEYDWIVAPGADYRSVKLRVEGSDGIRAGADGSLQIALRFGQVRFDIPEAYQVTPSGKQRVGFSFVTSGKNRVGFRTPARLDARYPLVIDPTLVWGTWFDGNSTSFDAYLFATARDAATGDIYAAGYVNVAAAAGYLPSGGYDPSYNSSNDAVVYTVSADGKTLKYATYFGGSGTGSGNDFAYALSLSSNSVFVAGEGAAGLPMSGTTTSFDSSNAGGQDGFVAVFTKTLAGLQYATYLGGAGNDAMYSVRALSDTSFVVSGFVNGALSTSSPNYIVSSADSTAAGQEGYVAKFGTLNTLTFGTYVGGAGDETLNDVKVMTDGRVAFAGNTTSTTSFPAEVASQAATGLGTTGFVGTIPSAGASFQYLDLIGGAAADFFNGLTVDGNDLYWTGTTLSSDLPLGGTPGFDTTYSGDSGTPPGGNAAFPLGDMLVARVTVPGSGAPSGYKATYFGCGAGCGSGQGTTGVVIDLESPSCGSGAKYLAIFGARMGAGTITTQNINGESFFGSTYQGTIDMFISILDSGLGTTPYFATYAGGANSDYFGATGVPRGSNHLTVSGDQFILGTTSHSASSGAGQHVPQIVGDATFSQAAGTVFDPTRTPTPSATADAHVLFNLSYLGYDYGDAPSAYGTSTARHRVSCVTTSSSGTLHLGSSVDAEGAGNPGNATGATVDDSTGGDDEDGVALATGLDTGDTTFASGTITVLNTTGQTATLYGWIDFNRNNQFELSERKSTTVSSNASPQTTSLTWTGLSGLVAGQSYARFRLTTGTIDASGTAPDGEIEDYPITIGAPTAVTLSGFAAAPGAGRVVLGWSTAQERNLLGFHVWRAAGAAWKRIDARLIPARAPGTLRGNAYRFADRHVRAGGTYSYRLEIVERDGTAWSRVRRVTVARVR